MLCPSRLTTEYTRVYTNTEEHKTWRIIILQNERTNKQTNKQTKKMLEIDWSSLTDKRLQNDSRHVSFHSTSVFFCW